jgi:hypothetical protein
MVALSWAVLSLSQSARGGRCASTHLRINASLPAHQRRSTTQDGPRAVGGRRGHKEGVASELGGLGSGADRRRCHRHHVCHALVTVSFTFAGKDHVHSGAAHQGESGVRRKARAYQTRHSSVKKTSHNHHVDHRAVARTVA